MLTQIKHKLVKVFRKDFRVSKYIIFIAKKNNNKGIILLQYFMIHHLSSKYHIETSRNTYIGKNLYTPHPFNIVIGHYVKIGNNCKIYHNVTLGQNKGAFPTIGDNVIIYTGAKIFGNINIGENAVIGAGAVVTKDVVANTIVAGNPAKIIGYRKDEDKYN